jgi:hypothetical protein
MGLDHSSIDVPEVLRHTLAAYESFNIEAHTSNAARGVRAVKLTHASGHVPRGRGGQISAPRPLGGSQLCRHC